MCDLNKMFFLLLTYFVNIDEDDILLQLPVLKFFPEILPS
jgi:hypothetical protein